MVDFVQLAERGDVETIQKYFDAGEMAQENLDEALYHAVREEQKELARFLVEKGANVNVGFANVAGKGWIDLFDFMLEKGANANPESGLPLVLACQQGRTDIVEALIAKGADVNAAQGQPLLFAATRGYLDIVKLLVKNNADLHPVTGSSLSVAKNHGHNDICEFLEQSGAKPAEGSKVVELHTN